MKKKIFLMVAIVAMLVCLLAISVSASVSTAYDKTEKVTVTLTNGTQECALYDADGDELVWYTLDGGATVVSIKAKDLVYSSETSLATISLSNGTVLQKYDDSATNAIVVANFRGLTFTTFSRNGSYKTTFISSALLQYVYLPSTVNNFIANVFMNCEKLKVIDIPDGINFVISDSNTFYGCSSLIEINLTGLTSVTGSGHFSGCSSLSRVIGIEKTSITRIGDSMFKNTAITEFTVPNTVTYIGQSAFNSCKNLKVIRLGDSVESFGINGHPFYASDLFNTCTSLEVVYMPATLGKVEGYTFISCNKLVTIFYTGDETQATSIIENAGTTNNAPFFALTKISYEEFMQKSEEEQKTGKFFVYGYNLCDAFYDGIHTLDPEKSNDCAGECSNCKKPQLSANPVHNYVTKIEYTNYLANGTKTMTCQNEGCAHKTTPIVSSVNAIIGEFKGFSVNCDGDAITFGYTINYDALDEFVKITGKTVELGFVACVKDFVSDDVYTSENAIKANIVTWTTDNEVNEKTVAYTGADFVLRGNWDRMVDLNGDEIAETNVKNVEFYMAGYMIVNGSAVYLNANGSSASADVATFAECDKPETSED